jgi:hypothetical protein
MKNEAYDETTRDFRDRSHSQPITTIYFKMESHWSKTGYIGLSEGGFGKSPTQAKEA